MNLKGRNLTQGLTGADVTELHNELIALGFTIPPAEQQAANFGQGTFTAVQQFQTKQGLPITGVVEATTAAELGQIIILSTYTVSGTITSPVSAGVGGTQCPIGCQERRRGHQPNERLDGQAGRLSSHRCNLAGKTSSSGPCFRWYEFSGGLNRRLQRAFDRHPRCSSAC